MEDLSNKLNQSKNIIEDLLTAVLKENKKVMFKLSTGRNCYIGPVRGEIKKRHFVVFSKNFIKDLANDESEIEEAPSDDELEEMLIISLKLAKGMSLEKFGEDEKFSIVFNSLNVGSYPKNRHIHIFLFKNRLERKFYMLKILKKRINKLIINILYLK